MFYGRSGNDTFGTPKRTNRQERFEQMSKQQEIIEQKRLEILKKRELEKLKEKDDSKPPSKLARQLLLGKKSPPAQTTWSSHLFISYRPSEEEEEEDEKPQNNKFSNDGSFFEQFKRMQEEMQKKKEEEELKYAKLVVKDEPSEYGEKESKERLLPTIKILNVGLTPSGNPSGTHLSSSSNNKPPTYQNSPPRTTNQSNNNNCSNNEMTSGSGNNGRHMSNVPPPNFYQGNRPPPPPPHVQHAASFQGPRHQGLNLSGPPPPPPPPPLQNPRNQGPHGQIGSQPPHLLPPHLHQQGFGVPPQGRDNFDRGMFGGFQNVPPPPPPPPLIPPLLQNQFQRPPQMGPMGGFPSPAVKDIAARVAAEGDNVEEMIKMHSKNDPLLWFLNRPDSAEYRCYRDLITQMRDEKQEKYGGRPICPVPPVPPPLGIGMGGPMHGGMSGIGIKQEICRRTPSPPQPLFENRIKMENDYRRSPSPDERPGFGMAIKREASNSGDEDEDKNNKKRKSRWGPQSAISPPGVSLPPMLNPPGVLIPKQEEETYGMIWNFPGSSAFMDQRDGTSLSRVTRTNPQLLAYAKQSYGSVNLDEDQWKQCEEAFKMNLIFQDIARKKILDEKLALQGKFKHEYDSDEEVDEVGTWEHKQRTLEMEKTKDWAQELTAKAQGKHHIGDFLPPNEFAKFMEKYKAVKEGQECDDSAYQEFKIAEDNVGFKMLQKMGWTEGDGLGFAGQGIVNPIDKGNIPVDKQGLGSDKPSDINEDDDEYAAYRKRMMLAYRFRPNPLNNPRRAYY